MSFQWVFDNAETLSMDRRKMVATTTARDGMTRSVERGSQLYRFVVKLPDGIPWSILRPIISNLEYLDKLSTDKIYLNNSGYNWMVKYQGDSSNYAIATASWTKNSNTITLNSGLTVSSGYRLRAGDFVQLGTGSTYNVAQDVPMGSNSVILHRPVKENTGSGSLYVAEGCSFNVKCQDFPSWTLMARDQVAWSGPFTFIEVP